MLPLIYWISVIVLGVLMGFLIGASQSPVVGVAIPIFAAFLTGTAGWILGRSGTQPLSEKNYRRIGIGFILISTGFAIGYIPGVVLRLGPVRYLSLGPYAIDWSGPSAIEAIPGIDDRMLAFAIDAHLKALGVEPVLRDSLIRDLAVEAGAAPAQPAPSPEALAQASTALGEAATCLDDKGIDVFGIVAAGHLLQGLADAVPTEACDAGCMTAALARLRQLTQFDNIVGGAPNACFTDLDPADKNAVMQVLSGLWAPSPYSVMLGRISTLAKDFKTIWGQPSGLFTNADEGKDAGVPVPETL